VSSYNRAELFFSLLRHIVRMCGNGGVYRGTALFFETSHWQVPTLFLEHRFGKSEIYLTHQ